MDVSGLAGHSGELASGTLSAPRKEGREVCHDPTHAGLMSVRKSLRRCLRFCEVPAVPQALGWLRLSQESRTGTNHPPPAPVWPREGISRDRAGLCKGSCTFKARRGVI